MDIGVVFEQETQDVDVPVHGRVSSRMVVAFIDVGTVFEQEPDDLDVSSGRRAA